MAKSASQWIQVAAFSDIFSGEAKAVRLGPRSVALFNVDWMDPRH